MGKGVRQGCLLGPLIFIFLLLDIDEWLKREDGRSKTGRRKGIR